MSSKLIASGGAGAALMGIALSLAQPVITKWEGRELSAYKDIVGVVTVCEGHTGKYAVLGKTYTDEQCSAMTQEDAKKFAEGVLVHSSHLLWHPMQFAAAIVLSYNIGIGAYGKSSIKVAFNNGDFITACNKFPLYNKAGGKVVKGLVNRRADETSICLSTLTAKGMENVR